MLLRYMAHNSVQKRVYQKKRRYFIQEIQIDGTSHLWKPLPRGKEDIKLESFAQHIRKRVSLYTASCLVNNCSKGCLQFLDIPRIWRREVQRRPMIEGNFIISVKSPEMICISVEFRSEKPKIPFKTSIFGLI
uniref:Uncharacterized protein n=1 Tax=Micrurus lemniscatus lemniscatus TaxID=129467 RepID=A0A2D4I9V9_MICLE